MSPERESLWARKRTAWHKDAARTTLREATGWIQFWLLLIGIILMTQGWQQRDQPLGWILLSAAPCCLLIIWALRTGRDWARKLCGGFSLLLAVTSLALLVVGVVTGKIAWWRSLWYVAIDLEGYRTGSLNEVL